MPVRAQLKERDTLRGHVAGIGSADSENINTYDTTAVASDIRKGETAVSKGKRITGSLEEVSSINCEELTPDELDDTIYLEGTQETEAIIRSGAKVRVSASKGSFGDALASDVTKDKYFTSAAGLRIRGTKVEGEATPPSYQTKTVIPGRTQQTIIPDESYDALSSVTVKGDANLISSNIKSGITIFGIAGSHEGDGGGSSGVDASADINNLHVWRKYGGASGVTETNVTNVTLSNRSKLGTNQSYQNADYADSYTISNGEISLVSPTTIAVSSQNAVRTLIGKYIHSYYTGKYYYIPSTAEPFTTSGTFNTMFGVTEAVELAYIDAGDFVENVYSEDANEYPTDGEQGGARYVYLGLVSELIDGEVASGGTDTSDANAVAMDIIQGATAYVKGVRVTGKRPIENISRSGLTPTLSGTSVKLSASAGSQIALDSSNTVSLSSELSNFGDAEQSQVLSGATFTSTAGIKKTGTHVCTGGATPTLQVKVVTPSASSQKVSPDDGYDGLSEVTISGDADLIGSNIKSGVNIFGVTGTYEGNNSDGATSSTYVWNKKQSDGNAFSLGTPSSTAIASWGTNNTGNSVTAYAADSVQVTDGVISLVDPTTVRLYWTTSNSYSEATYNSLLGKYVEDNHGDFYYIPTTSSFSTISTQYGHSVVFSDIQELSIAEGGDIVGYVTSSDRNAYPDNGVQGSYHYVYVGEFGSADLGDVTPADVTAGKTFSSVNGLKLAGTHVCDGGLDTTDATATASDIREGETAYVNGVKLTGTLEESDELFKWGATPTDNGGSVKFSMTPGNEAIVTKDTTIWMTVPYNEFGDAAASDVVKGKTFTSQAGLLVEGTYEGEEDVTLPTLTNPGTAADLASGAELIDGDGNIVTGSVNTINSNGVLSIDGTELSFSNGIVYSKTEFPINTLMRSGSQVSVKSDAANFGDATASDVTKGKTFTSISGLKLVGTKEETGGVTLPTLTSPGSASDLASGKELIDANGNVVTGSVSVVSAYVAKVFSDGEAATKDGGLIGVYKTVTENTLLRANSVVHVYTDGSDFGSATAADVAKGKTFTSSAGLKVVGTHECPAGIDTSDATATAEDIISPATAYVNGEKLTGSLVPAAIDTTVGTNNIEIDGNGYLCFTLPNSGTVGKRRVVDAGQSIKLKQTATSFGDATAADVAKGKTFTSVNGVKLTGTMEAAGDGGGYASGDIVQAWQTTNLSIGSGYTISVSYGSEVVNEDGTLSLGGTTGSQTISSAANCDVLKGKYIKPSSSSGIMGGSSSSGIYYIPEDATFTYSGNTYSKSCTVDKAHQMFVLA